MTRRGFSPKIAFLAALAVAALVGPSALRAQGPGPIVPVRAESSPLDLPLGWLYEAKRNYSVVKDYSCRLVSQESVKGTLQPQNVIDFKMKTQPFSVYMRWLSPEKSKGQEAAYVVGKNNGKMRVKSNHLGQKIIGWMSIDVNDPRVLQHSRHTIVEAGLGNMIEQSIIQWEKERPLGKTKFEVKEFNYDKRDCYRIELVRTEQRPVFTAFRTVMYLEKHSKLPVRVENYDWPRAGGRPEGELMEMFSYINLQFNTGLKDAEFDK
jgi:Protein of unknown function (DUF1571)